MNGVRTIQPAQTRKVNLASPVRRETPPAAVGPLSEHPIFQAALGIYTDAAGRLQMAPPDCEEAAEQFDEITVRFTQIVDALAAGRRHSGRRSLEVHLVDMQTALNALSLIK